MPVEILGPLRVRAGGVEITIGSGRERILLAVLLLHANRTVPTSQLIEAIWTDQPPPGARNQLHGCVSRVRKRLTSTGLEINTDAHGYRAVIAPEDLDLLRFRRLIDQARTAVTGGHHSDAIAHYRTALQLWRGPALTGTDLPSIHAATLDEEHVQVQQECIEAELATGTAAQLIPELTELVGRHPHREALHAALMLALYRTGRQADALATYRHARALLRDELGIEPGPELQRLHQAILNRDPALDPPAAPPGTGPATTGNAPAPRELPADATEFVGRIDALKQLDSLLDGRASDPPDPIPVTVISGTAGVGKTALAVHWAHQIADRFPDGQMFVDLRGFAPGAPLRPADVLPRILRTLGVPPDQIPTDEAEAAARYRSQVAGRRVLMVLDNAGSADQVRPLLPGTVGCLVLVTSRNRLTGLIARDGARAIELDVFTAAEAHSLLGRMVGVERVRTEPVAAGELARACAHLALALRIAAADLAGRPHIRVASYLADLTTGDPFSTLLVDDDGEDAVRGAFELSYRAMPGPAQLLFRRLGLVTGPDVTAPAAAALTGTTVEEAERWLRRLASSHLIEEHTPHRYTFHDLLRRYASQLAEAQDSNRERTAAIERMLHSFLRTADSAASLLYPQMLRLPLPPDVTGPASLSTAVEALAWLEAERANLVAAVGNAARHQLSSHTWLLADRLRGYFLHGRHLTDWLVVADLAVAAAERDGHAQDQAAAYFGLAHLHQSRGRPLDAMAHYDTAADRAARAQWLHCQAAAHTNLGMIQQDRGHLALAADHHARGLALNQSRNDLGGQAVNLVNLGVVDWERGRLRSAAEHLSRALEVNRDLDYQHGEAVAAQNLGATYLQLGWLDRAREQLRHAQTRYRQTGDRSGEAASLHELASAYHAAGQHADALTLAQRALTLAAELGDRRREADAHNTLGQVQQQAGEAALTSHREALTLARQVGVRRTETVALIGVAGAQHRLGDSAAATESVRQARARAREIGYRVLEGQATTLLSEILHGQRRDREALAGAERALEIHRETGHRIGEARTLAVLGHIQHATHSRQAAQPTWQAAYELFTEIGTPVPEELADQLKLG